MLCFYITHLITTDSPIPLWFVFIWDDSHTFNAFWDFWEISSLNGFSRRGSRILSVVHRIIFRWLFVLIHVLSTQYFTKRSIAAIPRRRCIIWVSRRGWKEKLVHANKCFHLFLKFNINKAGVKWEIKSTFLLKFFENPFPKLFFLNEISSLSYQSN